MKDNNQALTSKVVQVINHLFKENGKKVIPDVRQVCSKAQVTRTMALKGLYKWWEKQQDKEESSELLQDLPWKESQEKYQLQNAITHLQCIEKELEIYTSQDAVSPIGNFVLSSLQEVENKLYASSTYLEELNQNKDEVEYKLKKTLQENNRLYKKIEKIQQHAAKKLESLQDQLKARKKEAAAAHDLVKALKRDKRRPTYKSFHNALSH